MFNHYEPNVKAVIEFLRLQGVKVNNHIVNETLQNHPDWPSLLCISDALYKWNMQNAAIRIEKEKADELPVPFLAYTHKPGNALAIVTAVHDTKIELRQSNYEKPEILKREVFNNIWDGLVLFAERNENSGEPAYAKERDKYLLKATLPVILLILTVVISFLHLKINVALAGLQDTTIAAGIVLQFCITVAGLLVAAMLLWYEIDRNNPVLKKVCTGIAKGNCNAILTSKASKVFSWLSWSEVGFFYFVGAFLAFIFAGVAIEKVFALVAFFNLLAIVYPFFSVYYQWRVAKQWCVLCLAVQALLLIGSANIYFFNGLNFGIVNAQTVLINFGLYLLPVVAWYVAKPYLLTLQQAKQTRRQYLRTKFNPEIFDTLLKKQKKIEEPTDGLGISLGSPLAKHKLIKVCNPYCGPCAQAHPKIEQLLEVNKNVTAQIIFTTSTNEKDMGLPPVKHLLAIASEGNENLTKRALDDWYLAEKKDYELFALKHNQNGALALQEKKVAAMHKWCNSANIQYTPTIFIDGYQLPDAYSIEDLEYFLLE